MQVASPLANNERFFKTTKTKFDNYTLLGSNSVLNLNLS
jgi:hypothetical protein